MDLVKLGIVFAVVIVVLNVGKKFQSKIKIQPLSIAMIAGILLTAVLYSISFSDVLSLCWTATKSPDTLVMLASIYCITFMQRMLEKRGHLKLAQASLAGIFNNRRINASAAPVFIGMLPSPGAVLIAGAMVNEACEKPGCDSEHKEYFLTAPERCFVASYFRHISESFMPTYSFILIACTLVNMNIGSFVVGMIPIVALLLFLGYFIYLRKIPKDTGLPPSTDKKKDWKNLVISLWSILTIILIIIIFNLPVYLSIILVSIVYYFVNKFTPKEIAPYIINAFEPDIMINTLLVMMYKEVLTFTGVVNVLPDILSNLPIPTYMVFMLIFIIGTLIVGSTGIIVIALPLAFAAIPGAGLPLMVLLMGCTYAVMQISPAHICLFLACDYFDVSYGQLVRKTLPVLIPYLVLSIGYYWVLQLFF